MKLKPLLNWFFLLWFKYINRKYDIRAEINIKQFEVIENDWNWNWNNQKQEPKQNINRKKNAPVQITFSTLLHQFQAKI